MTAQKNADKKTTEKAKQTPPPTPPPGEPETFKNKRRSDLVYAVRGSQKNRFTQKEWEMLGKDKAGWKVDVEVPKEVQVIKDKG